MDLSSCISIARSNELVQKKDVYLHAFKNTVERVLHSTNSEQRRSWMRGLFEFDIAKIDFTYESYYLLIFLAANADHSQLESDELDLIQSYFTQDAVRSVTNRFLPKLLSVRYERLATVEWAAVRLFANAGCLSMATQNSLLNIVSRTFNDFIAMLKWKQCVSATAIHAVESALLTLEGILKNDEASVVEICKVNLNGVIRLASHLHMREGSNTGIHCEEEDRDFDQSSDSDQSDSENVNQVSGESRALIDHWSDSMSQLACRVVLGCLNQDIVAMDFDFPFSKALILLQSPNCDLQAISLSVILHNLKRPTSNTNSKTHSTSKSHQSSTVRRLTNVTPTPSNRKPVGKIMSKSLHSKKGRDSPQSRGSKSVESDAIATAIELCRNGQLRQVCWCLVHYSDTVRHLAHEVLMHGTSDKFCAEKNATNIWYSSILEQGLVPVLELVSCGFPISSRQPVELKSHHVYSGISRSHIFPERWIREWCSGMLQRIATVLATPTDGLYSKACLALLHTRSTRLRSNILTGLMYLSARNESISRLLQNVEDHDSIHGRPATADDTNRTLFRMLLSEVYVDESGPEMKSLLSILLHFLREGYARVKSDSENVHSGQVEPKDSRTAAERMRGPTTVQVKDITTGNIIKMQCPNILSVEIQSKKLACIMKVMCRPHSGVNNVIGLQGNEYSDSASSSKETGIVTLPGSYMMWQELFSHIVDEYICGNALPHLQMDLLIELYYSACEFEIPALVYQYSNELARRLSDKNIFQVFTSSLGKKTLSTESRLPSTKSISINCIVASSLPSLKLCIQCLTYMIDKIQPIVYSRDPLRNLTVIDIIDMVFSVCVHHYDHKFWPELQECIKPSG